tara:strand:+ start:3590 stop:4267 length:678 start_codon:yes stop_codon:yes gene_type:complete
MLLITTAAIAQETTEQNGVDAVIETVTDAANNLLGQDDESPAPDNPMAQAMSGVTEVATELQATVAQLSDDIQKSSNSSEEGARVLDEMLAAASNVNNSLDEDSEVWMELNTLLDTWSKKRDELTEKAETNPALQDVANIWQDRVTEGVALRTQILDQATASRLLVEDIEAQREVILAYYDVGATDQVLASMRKVSDQLGKMNDDMRSMLGQAGIEVPTTTTVGQ